MALLTEQYIKLLRNGEIKHNGIPQEYDPQVVNTAILQKMIPVRLANTGRLQTVLTMPWPMLTLMLLHNSHQGA